LLASGLFTNSPSIVSTSLFRGGLSDDAGTKHNISTAQTTNEFCIKWSKKVQKLSSLIAQKFAQVDD
jgi:hypothetical protein